MQVEVVVQPEGMKLTLDADLMVLAAGIEPNRITMLAKMLKCRSEDGFYLEAHACDRWTAADGVAWRGALTAALYRRDDGAGQWRGHPRGDVARARQAQSAAIIAAVNERLYRVRHLRRCARTRRAA
jgi:hypothetical protein